MGIGRVIGGRRQVAPPVAVPDEVVRTPLLDVLACRFDVAAAVVVAGAGFGKTTLLAQAVRTNLAAPRGVDAWVSCQPGDEDPTQLANAIATSLEATPATGDPVDVALQALVDCGPVDVCLVLDDLHEVPAGSGGAALLAEVVRRRPAHVHLMLASRRPPPVPLARLRAAGELVELDEASLALRPAEAQALAVAAGRPASRVADLAGWPSLVRLAVAGPPSAPAEYLWEEVVDALADDQRVALLALTALGCGHPTEIARVADRPVDTDALVAQVPLITAEEDGRLRVHQLWETAAARAFPHDDLRRIRARAVDLLLARGETVPAGWCAHRWGEPELLGRSGRALVRNTLGALPIETAERWLVGQGPPGELSPDLALLRLAVHQARHGGDHALDGELDALADAYAAQGDLDGEAVALALAVVGAHFRGDLGRLFLLAVRVRRLPEAGRDPVLRFLVGAVDAGVAALQGDVGAALAALAALPRRGIDVRTAELVSRLEVAMLLLAGRGDEATAVAEAALAGTASPFVRMIAPIVRWVAGDPSGMRGRPLPTEPDGDTDARDRLYHAVYGVSVGASLGDRRAVAALGSALDGPGGDRDARDSALVAGAAAIRRVLVHDEPGAADALGAHLARFPLAVPSSDMHLRRVLAVAYVLRADVRAHWDGVTLGPTHERARMIGQALVAARHGRVASDPPAPPPVVLTALPLPWSAELAVRATAAGHAHGTELAAELADWAGDALVGELERMCTGDDPVLRAGAERLLTLGPGASLPTLRIELLGPARLLADGEPVDAPGWRRGRVRTLATLLAVAGTQRRERVMDLMWPEHDPARASRNLRVILSRLRDVLEPGRAAHPVGRVLRVDGDTVALAASPRIEVDVWDVTRALEDADAAHAAGDATGQAEHLARVEALWRGEPLIDLDALPELMAEVEHVRGTLVDATLRLGELRLAAGRNAEATRCARRVRSAAPYDERALRLLVAAQMQRPDHGGLLRAVREVDEALAEIGAGPEPATEMLLRQARHRACLDLPVAEAG